MGDSLRVPTVVAVTLWAASALAVVTYTVIAFKETATDLEKAVVGTTNPLVASAATFAAEGVGGRDKQGALINQLTPVGPGKAQSPFKPLNRDRFRKSQ